MTELSRAALAELLEAEGFSPDSYRLHGGLGQDECYVLDQTPTGWDVFYSERGLKTSLRQFATEHQACCYLLQLLRRDPTTRQS